MKLWQRLMEFTMPIRPIRKIQKASPDPETERRRQDLEGIKQATRTNQQDAQGFRREVGRERDRWTDAVIESWDKRVG